MKNASIAERGSSLLELLVVVVVFTIITGAAFLLLNTAQQRFQMESQVLDSFQTARLAVDQITRDVHAAGYPPANAVWPAVAAASPQLIALPFAWSPTYPATPCTVGACTTPGSYDLIVEGNISPATGAGVQWIRYQLQGTNLMRGVANKTAGTDPATATAGAMVTYVDNVMNNTTAAQMTYLHSFYPGLFPTNTPVPVFTYGYDSGLPLTPPNIREVNITLIVMAATPDPKTKVPRVVNLTAQARRLNPNQ